MSKRLSLFSLLFIITITHADQTPPTAADIAQEVIKQKKSDFENKLDEFLQAATECHNEWLTAKEKCELDGDCATNIIFLALTTKKGVFKTKIELMEETKALNNKLEAFGVENGINLERTIRRILRR